MARYLARTCPRCGDYLGVVVMQLPPQAREFPILGNCGRCGYRLVWKLLPGKQEPRAPKRLFAGSLGVKTVMLVGLALLLQLLVTNSSLAQGQQKIHDYETARRVYFWDQLYEDGGEDLYCGVRFRRGQRLTVEHVYAADWIAEKFGCDNRHCEHPTYKFAEADLHNLWPALGAINSSRGKSFFGLIPGRRITLPRSMAGEKCSYKKLKDLVEPRRSVWGDIARSLFYMHVEYGLPLHRMLPVLKVWHRKDPPNRHERWRNRRISELQGTKNRFIETPRLADKLR